MTPISKSDCRKEPKTNLFCLAAAHSYNYQAFLTSFLLSKCIQQNLMLHLLKGPEQGFHSEHLKTAHYSANSMENCRKSQERCFGFLNLQHFFDIILFIYI